MCWRLRDVSVRFRVDGGSDVDALRGVCLTVAYGERLAVVGPNGSGKSTLALCLAGLIRPTEGSVASAGQQDTGGKPPDDPWAAIVFQYPDDNLLAQTVEEEIGLTLEHSRHAPPTPEALGHILTLFQLDHLRTRAISSLSGGEKQTLAIACAFAVRRDLIVLDEPTSHLDPPTRRRLVNQLLDLPYTEPAVGAYNPAIVLVTQYQNEARRFPRVVQLDKGRILYDGDPSGWVMSVESHYDCRENPPPIPVRRDVLLSANGLSQVPQPGWPLPDHPLSSISVTVHSGDAIGLCGPVGAGKSTLAYHLAGLVDSCAGELSCTDRRQDSSRPVVLIQFPERQLFCNTVLEEIVFAPVARGMTRTDAGCLARRSMDMVGLSPEEFGDRSPFSLSSGQQRRVTLAAIAACESSVFILDEPTGALDQQGTSHLEHLLQSWRASGKAYIVISHDTRWLSRVTSRLWVMREGHVIYDGSWEDAERVRTALEEIGFVDAAVDR